MTRINTNLNSLRGLKNTAKAINYLPICLKRPSQAGPVQCSGVPKDLQELIAPHLQSGELPIEFVDDRPVIPGLSE